MSEILSFDRTTRPASDHEVERAADDILAILRAFDSPKDAGAALTLAHFGLIKSSFPPAFRAQAIEAIDEHFKILKEFTDEGWH